MIKGAKAYFQTQVKTTTQGDLLIMLYDGAIKFLNQAKVKMVEKDYAQKGILISKAIDVIAELDGSLNSEKGGEVAQNLHNLYFFCNTRLLKANLEMNTEIVDEIIRILEGLREAFNQIKHEAPTITPPGAGATSTQSTARLASQPGAPMASAARAAAAYGKGPTASDADKEGDAGPPAAAPGEATPNNSAPPKAPAQAGAPAADPAKPAAAPSAQPADKTAPKPGLQAVPKPQATPKSGPQAVPRPSPQAAPKPPTVPGATATPPPASAPKPAPKLLRKPGLPGAYGNPDNSR